MGDTMTTNNLEELIYKKDWGSLIKNYSIKDLCLLINFDELMHLIEKIFYENMQHDQIQQFTLS